MEDFTRQLIEHGYLILFTWVLLDQAGLPLPSAPLLLAAGAVSGLGELNLGWVLVTAAAAALPGHLLLYEIGLRRGGSVLNLACRMSLEPDSCVRRTEQLFARHGARALLFARLVPALETVAPALAGVFRMRFGHFLAYSISGTLIWSFLFVGLGYVLDQHLVTISQLAGRLGDWLFVLLAGAFAVYLAAKYVRRQHFIRALDVARITPEELKQKLDAGEMIEIVDLRHKLDFEAQPETIPGAIPIPVEDLDERHDEIPRDREIVLYCT
jgi:membrane protein DedA with SNARE-associated domain